MTGKALVCDNYHSGSSTAPVDELLHGKFGTQCTMEGTQMSEANHLFYRVVEPDSRGDHGRSGRERSGRARSFGGRCACARSRCDRACGVEATGRESLTGAPWL